MGRHESVPGIVIEPSAPGKAFTRDSHECGSHVGHNGVKSMARALDTSGLSPVLAKILWPWIDIIETATGGMGGRVRRTAENTVTDLRSWIVMTPPLSAAIEDALHTSDALARDLDQQGFFRSNARTEALLALNALIAWLEEARPSGWPERL